MPFLVKVTDGLSELKDVDRVSVYEAGKDLAGAAVNVLARGLTLPYREVGAAAVLFLFLAVDAATRLSPFQKPLSMNGARIDIACRIIPLLRPPASIRNLTFCFEHG